MAIRVEIDNLIQAIDTENTAIDEALSSIDSQIANTSSALSSSSLSGKAYDALRERLTGLRIPALQREYVALEALRAGNNANRVAAESLPQTEPGVLDTQTCADLIAEIERENMQIRIQQDSLYSQMVHSDQPLMNERLEYYQSLVNINLGAADVLRAIMARAEEYQSASTGFYREASAAKDSLNAATASVASFVATGNAGDLSWREGVGDAYFSAFGRQLDRIACDESKGSIALGANYVYVGGKRIALDSADEEDRRRISEALIGLGFNMTSIAGAEKGKATAKQILASVGITGPGKVIRHSNGTVSFRGYKNMAGSPRMTTHCLTKNIDRLSRPSAAIKAEDAAALGRRIKVGGYAITGVFAVDDAITAYDEVYAAGAGLPEDRRQSDAEAAVIGSAIQSGSGALASIAIMVAVGLSKQSGPIVAGVSCLFAAFAGEEVANRAKYALDHDYNGDGESTQQDIADWWFESGGHEEVKNAMKSVTCFDSDPEPGSARDKAQTLSGEF